jgi:hypothetical protein
MAVAGDPQTVDVVVIDSTYASFANRNVFLPLRRWEYRDHYTSIQSVNDLLNVLLLTCGIRPGHKVIRKPLIIGHGSPEGAIAGSW